MRLENRRTDALLQKRIGELESMNRNLHFAATASIVVVSSLFGAEPADTNYDESKVPQYTLPELLVDSAGQPVTRREQWIGGRRDEIMKLMEQSVYGATPEKKLAVRYEVLENDEQAFGGLATRKQIRVVFGDEQLSADILLYVPHRDKPVPAFLGLNFYGNQTVANDPEVLINAGWMRGNSEIGINNSRATPETRGVYASRWQVEKVLRRGYALATVYCGDFDPDNYRHDFTDGVHPLFYEAGQTAPKPTEWGAIGGWAWGLSRVLDYLETDDEVDAKNVAVLGHSRLGKTALWAGAQDERFALVISNNSGCGGAALYRRCFGERIHHMIKPVGYWFCHNHRNFEQRESELPVDQHMLMALIAPRPLYVASATKDQWADPRGEFLAAKQAGPVYALFGKESLTGESFPAPDQPLHTTAMGYHLRSGKHDVTDFDWEQYLKFADGHLRE